MKLLPRKPGKHNHESAPENDLPDLAVSHTTDEPLLEDVASPPEASVEEVPLGAYPEQAHSAGPDLGPEVESFDEVGPDQGYASTDTYLDEDKKHPGWLQRVKGCLKFRVPMPDLKRNQRTVTVSLEKEVIQVVVFKGKRVVKWGTADLSHEYLPADLEAEEPSSDQDSPAALLQNTLNELGIRRSGRLWKLADKMGIRRGRVVMDLSLYNTLMRHLQIPKVRGRYLEPVVISEVLESLPFSKDEVDITWQLRKDDEGQSVFAIALPKERIDDQVRLVREAGLIPAAAYSKASALARYSGVANGILVHLEAAETALVLVHGGEPKVVHQLEFGSEGQITEEHTGALIRAIEQVAGYFQPQDPSEQDLGPVLPVILTGQGSQTPHVTQSLLRKLRRKVLTIDPPVRYPAEFPLTEYATNLGLFLADRGLTSVPSPRGAGMTVGWGEGIIGSRPLNLLPRRHQPRPVPIFQASIFIILILLAIHPYNVTGRVDAKITERNAIAQELRSLQREERQHDVLLASYQENNHELESANEQMANLETQLEELQAEMDTLLARLSTITNVALPPGVKLSAVSPLDQDFNVIGTASNHTEALRYVASLRDSPLFAEARILRLDGAGGANPDGSGTVGFQIRVTTPVEEDNSEEDESE